MLKIKISQHKEFYKYLEENNVPNNQNVFTFLHLKHFVELTTSFLIAFMINKEIDKLIKGELILPEKKEDIRSYIDPGFIQETEYFISNSLLSLIKEHKDFSVEHFLSFFVSDIQKQVQSVLFNSLPYLSYGSDGIELGEEKTDVLYMVIENNGSVTIEKKDCTVISTHSYFQQEQSIAEVLYYNPTLLIVYDSMHLLKPELVALLKKILRKKVVFLEELYPLRKN